MNISEKIKKKYTEKGEKHYEQHIYEPGAFLAEIQ